MTITIMIVDEESVKLGMFLVKNQWDRVGKYVRFKIRRLGLKCLMVVFTA